MCFGLRYGEDGGSWAASVVAVDEGGAAVFSIDELKTRALDRGALMSRHGGRDDLYELEWVPVMSSSNGSRPRVVLLGGGPVGVPGELECYADLGALEDAIAGGVAPPEVVVIEAAAMRGGTGDLADGVYRLTADAHSVVAGVSRFGGSAGGAARVDYQ